MQGVTKIEVSVEEQRIIPCSLRTRLSLALIFTRAALLGLLGKRSDIKVHLTLGNVAGLSAKNHKWLILGTREHDQ